MTFEPLTAAPLAIQLHVAAAMGALLLGPIAILTKRRDWRHKSVGYVWIGCIVTTALSSFWISGIAIVGPFGPIHLLSLFVLWSVFDALAAAIRKDISAHRAGMTSLYIYAVVLTGMFTLLPGRFMNQLVLGGSGGWALTLTMVAVTASVIVYRNRHVLPLGKVRGLH